MKRVAGVLMVVALVSGCASMSVTIEHSQGVDFSEFKTFQYKDSDMSLADTNSAAHRRTVDALKRELSANGLTETDSRPDLFVTYYGEIAEDATVDPATVGYNASSRWYAVGDTTTFMSVDRGSTVVDLWDASSNDLVWRGRADKMLSRNPDANLAKINEGIAKMFRSFPPGS
ncbi:MAG: DUF4136 domain-containing protein [Thermoanaerobaculia bacterium]